jgi:hypothetical protein
MRAERCLILLSLLVLPVILPSCSGDGSSETPTAPTSPTTPATSTPPAPVGLLWRTNSALFRSQTDGSGVVTLVDAPEFDPFDVHVSDSTVVYHITAPPVPGVTDFGLNDIWKVQTNGTGNSPVVNTADAELIRDVFGPWVIYERVVYAQNTLQSSSYRSARLDGPGQGLVTDALALYDLHIGERAVFTGIEPVGSGSIFSVLLDGTDVRTLADIPSGSPPITFLTPTHTIGNQVLFSQASYPQNTANIFSVLVTGGPVLPVTQGDDYTWIGAIIGSRIVYHRCPLIPNPDPTEPNPIAGPCDVYSVLSDGSGNVALATHPETEFVQGVLSSQVLIRRVGSVSDTLFSIPVTGGAETFMLTLAQNEFVSGVIGDRVILRRSTGVWSMKADGSGLVQLTNDSTDSPNGSTGPFSCFQRGLLSPPGLWCVPADGSGPATHVAPEASFVSGL